MMRGTFSSKKVDFGDGHQVLNAQQQQAAVEMMKHRELMDFKDLMGNTRPRVGRNPLLAEETRREDKREVFVRDKPPNRILIGGTFVLAKDLLTCRRETSSTLKKEAAAEKLLRQQQMIRAAQEEEDALNKNKNGNSVSVTTGRGSEYAASSVSSARSVYSTVSAASSRPRSAAPRLSARSRLEDAQRASRREQFSERSHKSAGRTPKPEYADEAGPEYSGRSDYSGSARSSARSSATTTRSLRMRTA